MKVNDNVNENYYYERQNNMRNAGCIASSKRPYENLGFKKSSRENEGLIRVKARVNEMRFTGKKSPLPGKRALKG
ncbi:hypothetical protein EAG21025_07250 [Enterobacter asburiae]